MSKKDEKVVVDEQVELKEEIVDEKEVIIKELEIKIETLTNEIEKIKKAAADLVNRNKQIEVDKKYAASDLVRNLLVPISYFEGALKFKSEDEAFNNFLKGFEMVYNLLLETLKSDGLNEINTNVNDPFNPYIHEVTEVVEVEDEKADLILEVLQTGFTYKDRVIKPVKVKVSKLKIETNENNENNEDNQEMVN